MNIDKIRAEVTSKFENAFMCEKIKEDGYSSFSYPKLVKMMKFDTVRHKVAGFGQIMSMRTKGPFGMRLLTMSFMPYEGGSVPYLLIDMMTVGKKITVFVEYYDCTADKSSKEELVRIKEKYDNLQEYDEKPKWYVPMRTPYSLIKCGQTVDSKSFYNMIIDSVDAYISTVKASGKSADNIPGLSAFRDRMINEGNPSSSILEKVFGKEGAEEFFKECVMPIRDFDSQIKFTNKE